MCVLWYIIQNIDASNQENQAPLTDCLGILGVSFTTNGRKSVSDPPNFTVTLLNIRSGPATATRPGPIMTLSTEAVIAIIGVIVSLPPAVVALRKLMRSKEAKATALSCSHSPHSERRLLLRLTLAQVALVQHQRSYQNLSLILPPCTLCATFRGYILARTSGWGLAI